jgi:hypothetical protein
MSQVILPSGLAIDPAFSAVPLGGARVEEVTLERLLPQYSETFAVRAFFETDAPRRIPAQLGDVRIFSDPVVEPLLTCQGTPAVGTAADVKTKLDTLRLSANGLDGTNVAVAIVDMGINLPHLTMKLGTTPKLDAANSWAPAGVPATPGQYPLQPGRLHGTACAYDALIAARNATLLDYPFLLAQPGGAPPPQGGPLLAFTLYIALQAYSVLLMRWALSKLPGGVATNSVSGGLGSYTALVISNSWGVYNPDEDFPPGNLGRYVDNPLHPFQLIVSWLAELGADIIFAAGDCGADCPNLNCKGRTIGSIMGANANAGVLSLAGCDIHDQRAGYSSQGPSIAGMPPKKPDVTAFTHFLGSEVRAGMPDTGASAACAVAAGCVAALRTKTASSAIPPAALFRLLRSTARQVSGPRGWNSDYGYGIIDPIRCGQSLGTVC